VSDDPAGDARPAGSDASAPPPGYGEGGPRSRSSEPVELAPTETAGDGVGLAALAPGRRAVLEELKHRGEAGAEELAQGLGITVSAVRQHLAGLEADELVAHGDVRAGPGRPRRRWCLTPAADMLWPKRYGQLANQLLGYLEQTDAGLVDGMFERRRLDRVERASARLDALDADDRVRELTRILDEDGYLARAERLGPQRWRVVEHNCAIVDVARHHRAACATELSFLRAVMPGASVVRTAHLLSGGHVCAYEINFDDEAEAG
jgi:DeoR family suf operon transcriptional repressor